jgi:hypothetical protein
LWPKGEALGQRIQVDSASGQDARNDGAPHIPAQLFTVIGVVKDVHSGLKMFDLSYSGIYLPSSAEQSKMALIVRVRGNPDAARRTLLDALTKADPALGEITTMRMVAGLGAAVLKVVFWLAVILSSLALALTVSGLFSVLTYLVEQRRPESAYAWPSARPRVTSCRSWCRKRCGRSPRASCLESVSRRSSRLFCCPRRSRTRSGPWCGLSIHWPTPPASLLS